MATKRKPATQPPEPVTVVEPAAGSPTRATKLEIVIAALRSPDGSTIPDLVDLTGWQEKSVRGFISGALKTKRKLKVTSTKSDGVRTYRIEEPAA